MSRGRPNSRRRKNKRHRKLTPLEKNEIVVLREMGLTYKKIAEKTQFAYPTVVYTYKKASEDPDLVKKARGEALIRAAQESQGVAMDALRAITPDSLRADRIEVHDDAGNLIDVRHRGPSPLQLGTLHGILVDKAMKMQDRGDVLMSGQQPALTPDAFTGLLGHLRDKLTKLSFTVDLDLSEVSGKLDNLQSSVVEAEYEDLGEDS